MEKLTRTISARVPLDVADMFDKLAEAKGFTKSKYMTSMITSPQAHEVTTFAIGGQVATEFTTVPDEIKDVLSAFGGVAVGVLLYRVVNDALNPRYDKNERMLMAGACAIAGGLLSSKLIKELTKGFE